MEGTFMKTSKINRPSMDDYLELVKAFPLRVIRSDVEHEEAVTVLSRLVGRENATLTDGARQYADALARFIQDYDQKEYPLLETKRSPLEKLKYLLQESGLTPGQLARVIGASQPLVSHILTGKRNLTTAHMRKLGEHFKIAPGYFL
jgi:HTH-type transcriptional regulator/antitoxin HigA